MIFKIKRKNKAMSPIIAIILLVVICVILITIITNWGTDFTNTSLSKTTTLINTPDETTGLFFVKNATNRAVLIFNSSNKDVTITKYSIIDNSLAQADFLNKKINLYPNKTIKSGEMEVLEIACFPSKSFKLNLYTMENKYIELQVNPSNFSFQYCEDNYNPEINLTCPQDYISVPGNANYGVETFCVQQYEARLDSGYINNTGCMEGSWNNDSTATVKIKTTIAPLSNINLCVARKLCENSGAHLITNNEWMTIARNLEQVSENWTGGSQESGVIKRGNVGYLYIDDEKIILEGGYSPGESSLLGGGVDYGEDQNDLAKLVLSNGEEIWDFSGNLAEWIDLTIIEDCDGNCIGYPEENDKGNDSEGVQGGSPGFEGLTIRDWYEFTDLTTSGTELTYNQIKPFNDYNSNQGVGKIYVAPGKANNNISGYVSNIHGVVRGGTYFDDYAAGIFAMNLRWAPNYISNSIGFRCAISLDN